MTRGPVDRTVSIGLRERGQTTQDFAVGIGVFMLAIAFVFSFVPSMLSPYDSGGGESAQADRVAAAILENVTDEDGPRNHVNGSAFDDRIADHNSTELATDLGLRSTSSLAVDRVNVSLESVNQSSDLSRADRHVLGGGDPYDGSQSAAAGARIVSADLSDLAPARPSIDEDDCDPACRLVVRVW